MGIHGIIRAGIVIIEIHIAGKGHRVIIPHALHHLIAHLVEGQLLHLDVISQIIL